MAASYRPPAIPDSFSTVLESKGNSELEALIHTDEEFTDLFEGISQVQSLKEDITTLTVMNRTAAEATLSRESELRQARERLADACETMRSVRAVYEERKTALEERSRNFSAEAVVTARDERCSQEEAESQSLADAFLEGEYEVDAFVSEYVTRRQQSIISRLHVDKLKVLLVAEASASHTLLQPHGAPLYYSNNIGGSTASASVTSNSIMFNQH